MNDDLEFFFYQEGDSARIGVIDLKGESLLPKGTLPLVRLPGRYEIVKALVSDLDHRALVPAISAATETTNLPDDFALHQNYPNPFNPTTEISFALPQSADVKLEVFNILGQEVATLIDGYLEAAEHSITWDSSTVASGIYFYRIKAREHTESRKMLLLK